MRKLFLFVLVVSFLCGLAQSDPMNFRSYGLTFVNMPSFIYETRIKAFSRFFGDENLNWNEDGLFLFYEKNGLQKLFFISGENRNQVAVYQLPNLGMSHILNPEKYISKREKKAGENIDKNLCFVQLTVDSSVLTELDSLLLYHRSFLTGKTDLVDAYSDVVLGFNQKENKRDYFFFKKIKCNQKYWNNVFDVYLEIFKFVENLNKKKYFPGCR